MTKKVAPKAEKPSRLEIHILNGPNLNMLGFREPEIYGAETLAELEKKLRSSAKGAGIPIELRFFQTNHEGDMIDYIQSLALGVGQKGGLGGLIVNPAAWTHTSIAIRDALIMLKPVPIIEVHLSNPAEREEFRQYSFLSDIADYSVAGMGQDGYLEALRWLITEMQKERLDVH